MTTDEESRCVFCDKISEGSVTRVSPWVVSFEPLNPVTPGHRLFVPVAHFMTPDEMPPIAGLAFTAAARHAGEQGRAYNLIVNAGDAASQTIPHVHVHYVPRERNDGLKLPWTEQHAAAPGHQAEAPSDRAELIAELRQVALILAGDDDHYEAGWVNRAIAALAARPVVDDAALRELVDRGVGFDLNPTMLIDTPHSVYAQWAQYAGRLDAAWRDQVRAALGGDQ